ncbi:hypothetical protein PHMEG_00017573, partial [Phytophthora megakarya]
SAEASRAVMENKPFTEQCARANAETWAQQCSADRDAAHKEIKLVKSREASLDVQISQMNAVIKSHQEMYDRLENRFQLALRSNEILTKEVNHGRSEYLVWIQEVPRESPQASVSHQSEGDHLTSKLRERNRELVRRVKRLEKANSALSSRLRLEDMDPEALVLMVEVSSESESESSSYQDSSTSESVEAHEDEQSELSKLRPESQCLEDSLDDILDAPAPASSSVARSHAGEASTKAKSKAKPASEAKADSKSSPKSKKKVSPKPAGNKKSSAKTKKVAASKKKSKSSPKTSRSSKKTKSQDAIDESSLDTNLPDWISKYPELVKLVQRASDLLTPYVAPEFTTVSTQKYWVKLDQAFLPSPVPSDDEVKCTTVGVEKFCRFMDPDHPWRKAMDLWPEHACSADWWAEAALVDKSKPYRVDRLTCPERHPYNTVYVSCNAHVPPFFPVNSTVEALGPQIVPDSSLEPKDIDSSWDGAFRGADEGEEMEEGEVEEDDADSTATLDLNQDSTGDTPVDHQDAAAEDTLILLFADSSPPSKSGVVAEI